MSVRVSSDETGAQQRPCRKHHGVRCMAPGCCNPLSRQYNVKKRLCTTHMKAEAVQRRGYGEQMFRFCQQCGKLELLARFEGTKRSCVFALQRKRANARSLNERPSVDGGAAQPTVGSPVASSMPQSPGPWQQQHETASGAPVCQPSNAPAVAPGSLDSPAARSGSISSSASLDDAANEAAQLTLADVWASTCCAQACSGQRAHPGEGLLQAADVAAADEWVQFLVREASMAPSCCTTDKRAPADATAAVDGSADALMSDAELEALIEAALREAVSATAAGAACSGAPAPSAACAAPSYRHPATLQQAAGAAAGGAGTASATVAGPSARSSGAQQQQQQQQQQQLGVDARLHVLQAQYSHLCRSVKGVTDALHGIISLQCTGAVAAASAFEH